MRGGSLLFVRFVLAFGWPAVAFAQTTVLDPFTLSGELRVTDRTGQARPVDGLDLVASGATPNGALVSTATLLAGPTPRFTLELARVSGGAPIAYEFWGESRLVPTLVFQGGSRRFGEAIPPFSSPATGHAALPIEFSGLCPLVMSVVGAPGRQFSALDITVEALDGSAYGQFTATTPAPPGTPPSLATGYQLATGLQGQSMIQGEVLLRGGKTYRIHGRVRLDGQDVGFVDPDQHELLASTCQWNRLVMNRPVVIEDATSATLTGSVTFRGEPANPLVPTFRSLTTRLLHPSGEEHRTFRTLATGGRATFGGVVATGTRLIRAEAALEWPDGRTESLQLPASAERWSPRLVLPYPAFEPMPPGLYPDTSVVLVDRDVIHAEFDAPLGYERGTLALSGCATLANLEEAYALYEGGPAGTAEFTDEAGATRLVPTPTERGSARTSVLRTTGGYTAALTPGPWRLGSLTATLRPPPTEGLGTLLSIVFDAARPLHEVLPGAAAARSVQHALAIGSVKVRLSVRNADGTLRPFRQPRAKIENHLAVAADGTTLGRYWSSGSAADVPALSHTVHLFATPGPATVIASALVPANPDGTGPESLTAFPPLANVPIRPPRADGSCAGICADSVEGVYWDDDLRGPSVTLDPFPSVVRVDHVRLAGTVTDEAPVDALTVNGRAVTLQGPPDATSRRFEVDVPLVPGTNTLQIEARDRCQGLGRSEVGVEWHVNLPPTFPWQPPLQVREGEPAVTRVLAEDADGPDPLTYTLDDDALARGATIDPATGAFRWTPDFDDAGFVNFRVSVSDGADTETTVLVVDVQQVNRAPQFVSIDGRPVEATGAVVTLRESAHGSFLALAVDPDGDDVYYRLRASGTAPLPPGLVIDLRSGRFDWRPGFDDAGDHVVELVAEDFSGDTGTLPLTLRVAPTNRPPMVDFPAFVAAREGEPLVVVLAATDPDGDTLRWTLRTPPDVNPPQLDADDGTFAWTPGFEDAGDWPFTVVISDGTSIALMQFTVVVAPVNRAPRIRTIGGEPPVPTGHVVDGREDVALALEVVADDPDGDAVTLELRGMAGGPVPHGLALGAGGSIEWKPGFDQAGRHVVELVARDTAGAQDVVTLVFDVEDVNRPPTLSAGPRADVRENEPLSWPFDATDPDGDVLAFSLRAMAGLGLPAALEVNGRSLDWTPGFGDAGPWAVELVVEDGRGGRATAIVMIDVSNVNRAPLVEPVAPLSSYGHPGAVSLVVSDPDGDDVRCTAETKPDGSRWNDTTRTLDWDELAHGPTGARIACTDGVDTTVVTIAIDVDWGTLVGGCECGGGAAPELALLWLLARRWRRRRVSDPRAIVQAATGPGPVEARRSAT